MWAISHAPFLFYIFPFPVSGLHLICSGLQLVHNTAALNKTSRIVYCENIHFAMFFFLHRFVDNIPQIKASKINSSAMAMTYSGYFSLVFIVLK